MFSLVYSLFNLHRSETIIENASLFPFFLNWIQFFITNHIINIGIGMKNFKTVFCFNNSSSQDTRTLENDPYRGDQNRIVQKCYKIKQIVLLKVKVFSSDWSEEINAPFMSKVRQVNIVHTLKYRVIMGKTSVFCSDMMLTHNQWWLRSHLPIKPP